MIEILVIERSGNLATALRRATEGMPVRVRLAGDGGNALGEGRSGPALAFVGTQGWRLEELERLIRHLRARRPAVPVAVVASAASAAQEVSLRRLGILCYLQTPLGAPLVRQVVRGAVRSRLGPRPPADGGAHRLTGLGRSMGHR